MAKIVNSIKISTLQIVKKIFLHSLLYVVVYYEVVMLNFYVNIMFFKLFIVLLQVD
jgi:hypothetical protein